MVDVKRVTAVVTKNNFKENIQVNSPAGGEYVNLDPSSAIVIDPFALFTQEDSKFKIKVPYSRFYKVKYTIFPYQTAVGGDNSNIFAWRSYVAFTNAISLMRLSSVTNTESEITAGVYKQDAVCFYTVIPTSTTTATSTVSFVSGIVEGIVELNAGDELRFKYNLSLGRKTFITGFSAQFEGNNLQPTLNSVPGQPIGVYNISPGGPVYTGPVLTSNINLDFPSAINYTVTSAFGTVNNPIFSAYFGFFFEISEITDL